MGTLTVGLVGCGGIGKVHAGSWQQVEGATIIGVCDVSASAAEAMAAKTGAPAFGSIDAMLAAGVPDIVDVCVPPCDHSGAVLAALAAGCHVICEKPLARTVAEAQAIVDAAAVSGKLLMTAFCHRFHAPILFAKQLIEEGKLGRLAMFRNRFSGLFAGVEDRWFSNPEVAGGGTMLDTAIHAIDLFRYLAGDIQSVSGETGTFLPGLKVEDSAVVSLRSASGVLGVIEASWATPGAANVVELYGTAGMCAVDYNTGLVTYQAAGMDAPKIDGIDGEDRFVAEVAHFAAAVRGEVPLCVTGVDGLRANEAVEAVYGRQVV